jgi:phage terminase large subunit GpA-like protein
MASRKKIDTSIFSEKEKAAWKLPREITVSQWADQNRVLDELTSAEAGKWHTSRTPYLKGIMDAFTDPEVERITIMKATQLGVTECLLNMLGYCIDEDPGPAMFVSPRETDAKALNKNRVQPMLNLSESLIMHKTGNLHDIGQVQLRLDRMIAYFSWAYSPAELAQRAIRYLFLDETDKYPKFSGKEADPIKLSTERTRTYWNRKIVEDSTPTTREGFIFKSYEASYKYMFHVPCPRCGEYQVLCFEQIKFPKDERDPEKIQKNRLAWYECIKCKKRLEEKDKQRMVNKGKWIPDIINKEGFVSRRHVGFWLGCYVSPWLTFSEIAAEFLRSKDYIESLMNFVNSWQANIWEEKIEETKPDQLRMKELNYPANIIPVGGIILLGSVDVQEEKNKLYFITIIRAWGYLEESWLVKEQRLESWEQVETVMFKTKYKIQGTKSYLSVRLVCIDARYKKNEVYSFCRRWKDLCRPIMGHQNLKKGVPFYATGVDKHPVTGKAVPGGLRVWHVDTSYFKDKMQRLLESKWHLHQNVSMVYLNQMCAEHKVIIRDKKTGQTKEEWLLVKRGLRNDYFDAENYNIVAADMIGVQFMRKDEDVVEAKPKEGIRSNKQSWVNGSRRKGKWL